MDKEKGFKSPYQIVVIHPLVWRLFFTKFNRWWIFKLFLKNFCQIHIRKLDIHFCTNLCRKQKYSKKNIYVVFLSIKIKISVYCLFRQKNMKFNLFYKTKIHGSKSFIHKLFESFEIFRKNIFFIYIWWWQTFLDVYIHSWKLFCEGKFFQISNDF